MISRLASCLVQRETLQWFIVSTCIVMHMRKALPHLHVCQVSCLFEPFSFPVQYYFSCFFTERDSDSWTSPIVLTNTLKLLTLLQLLLSSAPVVMASRADSLPEELSLHLYLVSATLPVEEIPTEHAVFLAVPPPTKLPLALPTCLGTGRTRRQQEHTRFLHPTRRHQLLRHRSKLFSCA